MRHNHGKLLGGLLLLSLSGSALFSCKPNVPDKPSSSEANTDSDTNSEHTEVDPNKLCARFVVLSDVHIKKSEPTEKERLGHALDISYQYAETNAEYPKVDAVLSVGDLVNGGTKDELAAFKDVLSSHLKEGTKHLPVFGNHELLGGSYEEVKALWRSELGAEPNSHETINGYHVISLSLDSSDEGFNDETLNWFKQEIAKANADSKEKPIFVQQHYPVYSTIAGSLDEVDKKMNKLDDILVDYENVIDFSGHSHYTIMDPLVIRQEDYTQIGCGSLSYTMDMTGTPEHSSKKAEFYIVEVKANNVVNVKPYDLTNATFYDFEYAITPKKDSFVYTDERKEKAKSPSFPAEAKVDIGEITDNSVDITFPQSIDKDISHYAVECFIGNELKETKLISDGKFIKPKPQSISAKIDSLSDSCEYSFKLRAVNYFGKTSEPLSFIAKTKKKISDVETDKMINGNFDYVDGEGVAAPTHFWSMVDTSNVIDRGDENKNCLKVTGKKEFWNLSRFQPNTKYIFTFDIKTENYGAGCSVYSYVGAWNGNFSAGGWIVGNQHKIEENRDWVRLSYEFTSTSITDNCRLAFVQEGTGTVYIDNCTLFVNVNECPNGDFENASKILTVDGRDVFWGWAMNNAMATAEDKHSGKYSLKWEKPSGNQEVYYYNGGTGAVSDLKGPKTYELSFFVKIKDLTGDVSFLPYIMSEVSAAGDQYSLVEPLTVNCDWTQIKCTFTSVGEGKLTRLAFQAVGKGTATIYIDDIVIKIAD